MCDGEIAPSTNELLARANKRIDDLEKQVEHFARILKGLGEQYRSMKVKLLNIEQIVQNPELVVKAPDALVKGMKPGNIIVPKGLRGGK